MPGPTKSSRDDLGTAFGFDASGLGFPDRYTIRKDGGLGYISENFPREQITASLAGVSGTVYFSSIGLRKDDIVNNVGVSISSLGSGLTLSKIGIYSSGGFLLGSTADLGTGFTSGSTGARVYPLSTAFRPATDALYYIGVISVGTTPPTLHGGSAIGGNVGAAIGGGLRQWAVQTAQADLPAAATFANATNPLWVVATN